MIYIFNSMLINYYVNLLNNFSKKYKHYKIYIAMHNLTHEKCANFNHLKNVKIYDIPNKGGDIGGFLFLIKKVYEDNPDYLTTSNNENINDNRYFIFAHTKTNNTWRQDLCSAIFNYDYKRLLQSKKDIGIICKNKWHLTYKDEQRRYDPHMSYLKSLYNIPDVKEWKFVGGTIMTLSSKITKYIYENDIDQIYSKLNEDNSEDECWINTIARLNKDRKGCNNDYAYRVKFNRSLHSDNMIEHTYERIIGLICTYLKLSFETVR